VIAPTLVDDLDEYKIPITSGRGERELELICLSSTGRYYREYSVETGYGPSKSTGIGMGDSETSWERKVDHEMSLMKSQFGLKPGVM